MNSCRPMSAIIYFFDLNLYFKFCKEFPGVWIPLDVVNRKNKKSSSNWISSVLLSTIFCGNTFISDCFSKSLLYSLSFFHTMEKLVGHSRVPVTSLTLSFLAPFMLTINTLPGLIISSM